MNELFRIAVETSLRAAVVASCVGAVLVLARVRRGAVLHGAWTAVLCAMLLMPVLPHLTPGISLPVVQSHISVESEPAVPPAAPARAMPVQSAPVALTAFAESKPAAAPAVRRAVWPWVVLAAYLLGALILLAHLAAGWVSARRLVRSAERVAVPLGGIPVYQSGAVAVPLTFGVLKPGILLPCTWSAWPAVKLRAVLAHEAAHIRRRDALVALATRVNRCLFWFHPLAWWLERKLAATAEQAADEAAVPAAGEKRAYVEILLDMAQAVNRRGGRLSWEGVAMDGDALERRIDRILRADFLNGISRRRKTAVAAGCAIAIFGAAACRDGGRTDSARVAQAEARDKYWKTRGSEYRAREKAERDFDAAAKSMTPQQAAALEAQLRANPDDLEAHRKLMAYYCPMVRFTAGGGNMVLYYRNPPVVDPAAARVAVAAFLPHYFWMVEHHPEDPAAVRWDLGIFPSLFDPRPNPEDLERARKLWLEQAERDARPAAVYANAFLFFRYIDKPMAEKMLLRTEAADPKGETLAPWMDGSWPARLGDFYGRMLAVNRYGVSFDDPVRAFQAQAQGPIDPQSAYAAEVRRKLDNSQDVMLLLSAVDSLVGMNGTSSSNLAFGKTLIQRALTLQPDSVWARQLLNMIVDQEVTASLPPVVWQGPLESRHQAIEALPVGDRFRELANLAIAAGDEGVRAAAFKHDGAAEQAAWQQAGKYAQEALDLAPQARGQADYGTAFFNANMTLGMAAVKAGDTKAAVQYLMKAGDAPATDALKYPIPNARPWAMNWHFPSVLSAALLKAGERDAVMAFLERYARITVADHDRCLEDIALIRQGKLPSWARS